MSQWSQSLKQRLIKSSFFIRALQSWDENVTSDLYEAKTKLKANFFPYQIIIYECKRKYLGKTKGETILFVLLTVKV